MDYKYRGSGQPLTSTLDVPEIDRDRFGVSPQVGVHLRMAPSQLFLWKYARQVSRKLRRAQNPARTV